jgi:hypothetical protein
VRGGRRPAGNQGIEDAGIKVGAVRPADRPKLRINPNRAERFALAQRFEHSFERYQGGEVDGALDAVLKAQVQAVAVQRADLNDVLEHGLTPTARSA